MSLTNTTMPRPSRIDRPRPSSLAILIEVPAVSASRHSSRRFDAAAIARPARAYRPGAGRARAATPTRRRLRREVHLAARVFLVLAIVVGGGTLLGMAGPGSATSTRDAGPSIPRVAISTEPAIAAPTADLTKPVIFTGYLLPDDALEAPDHEGG